MQSFNESNSSIICDWAINYDRNHDRRDMSAIETDSDMKYTREESYIYNAKRRQRKKCSDYERNENIVERLGYIW